MTRSIRLPLLLVLAVLLAVQVACQGRPTAAPTAVALPATETPAPATSPAPATRTAPAPTASQTALPPTATPSATASPAPPTATPTSTVPPTPDPNEGVGDVVYQGRLDGTGTWFWSFSDDVATFGIEGGQLKGVMHQANAGWRFTISPDVLRIGDQQVRVTAHTVACGENDEYGLLLRVRQSEGESPYDGYLFKLRCGGAAGFDLVRGTQTTAVVPWTTSTAIKTGAPADNTLMVWAAGSKFRFYANDQYLFSAEDGSLADGFYGLYLYDRTAGGMTVNYSDLVVRGVTAP
jgi:hypothetical protein